MNNRSPHEFARGARLSRGARTVRGLIVATLATLIAALSHMAAGGEVPSSAAVLLSTVIALPFVIFLSGQRSIVGTFAAVAGTQALFHWLFVWIDPTASSMTLSRICDHAYQVQQTLALFGDTPVITETHAGAMMTVAHTAAAAVTVWLLRNADLAFDALWNAVRWLGRRLTGVLEVLPAQLDRPRTVAQNVVPLLNRIVAQGYTLRGPPLVAHPHG